VVNADCAQNMNTNEKNEEQHVVAGTNNISSTIEALEIELEGDNNQENATCSWLCIRSRLKMLFCPIRRWETVYKECGDEETHLEVFPESFRICFVVYFLWFGAFATFITVMFGNTDFTDNPIFNTFGENSICVMFDDPPFSIFGSTLWFPAVVMLLAFEFFDYIRVREYYHDHLRAKEDDDDDYPITKGFFVYYTTTTVFESLSTILFSQVFATSPTEHLFMHSWPYLILTFSFFSIALKRFLFLWKTDIVPWYGITWIILCALSTLIYFIPILANLYGARLWEKYPWIVAQIVAFNGYFWGINMVLLAPIVVYGTIGMKIDTVEVVLYLNRKNSKSVQKK